ncbi:MAG: Na(+)-translocating NADH-quinone reductase subunit F [Thermoanaerobaculia bacterium]|nr:Na(+)-translocating NADH-quinone reductase subunit F [Thermoanaerobaculia bacterium]
MRIGSTVLDAALSLQAPMEHVCGGSASCTTCRFEVVSGPENLSPPARAELALDLGPGLRLGCQTRILGDVTIRIVKFPGKTVL